MCTSRSLEQSFLNSEQNSQASDITDTLTIFRDELICQAIQAMANMPKKYHVSHHMENLCYLFWSVVWPVFTSPSYPRVLIISDIMIWVIAYDSLVLGIPQLSWVDTKGQI